tara:strand:- start:32 stop:883 length:852 start_codon:yes stop_codon:yes gene_type:complete
MKLDQLSANINQRLLLAGIMEAMLESELLICKALDISKEHYYAELQTDITEGEINNINGLVKRRINREPLSYICSHREFYGLDLYVDGRVLIPRQETEIIVDKAIHFLKSKVNGTQHIKILDLGTGSGAIAIALAKFFPEAKIYATDVSIDALQVAKINCFTHNVDRIVNLMCLDGLTGFNGRVDIVVANPPYLSKNEMMGIQPELLFEPHMALYGGLAGWEKSVELIESASQIINIGGKAFFETSPESIDAISREISEMATISKFEPHLDYSGNNRVLDISF